MTLNVPEAKERAHCYAQADPWLHTKVMADDLLALAALARELADALDAERDWRDDPDRPTQTVIRTRDVLAKARAGGLLPASESAPAEPSKPE